MVLATCSTYFRSLFVGRSVHTPGSGCTGHPIVYIPDLSDNVMEHLLSFMYRGETTVPPHLLLPLIDAAKLLGIQGLMDPGNIKQLLEHNGAIHEHEQKPVIKEEVNAEAAKFSENIPTKSRNGSVEDIITQELKETTKGLNQESPKPDSSNTVAFPQIPAPGAMSGGMFPSPLALSLATGQMAGLGLDLTQCLALSNNRRKSDTTNNTHPVPSSSGTNGLNNSTGHGNGMFAHFPPTEDPSRPFGCTQCQKRFRMKHHLKEHMLIHSGELPFSCHLCPKRFNRSYTLKNHMKLHSTGAIMDKFQPTCT